MNQCQMLALAYILKTIGELDDKTSSQLMSKIPPGMYATADEALRCYESEESITIALVDWVKESWEQSTKSPRAFAKEILDGFIASIE